METSSIRVGTLLKTIEVNDAGETIAVNIGDYAFMADLADFAHELEDAAKKVAEKAAEINAESQDARQQIRSVAEYNTEICTTIKERVDSMLGEETCRKVFGDVLPSIPEQLDFVGQLTSLCNRFVKEAQEATDQKLAKYLDKYKK